jgi:antitoxin ParD1/3/4
VPSGGPYNAIMPMNLALTRELEKRILQRVRSGRYQNAQEVIAAALSSLEQQELTNDFAPGEWDRLLKEGEESGPALDGEVVLKELRQLRKRGRRKAG